MLPLIFGLCPYSLIILHLRFHFLPHPLSPAKSPPPTPRKNPWFASGHDKKFNCDNSHNLLADMEVQRGRQGAEHRGQERAVPLPQPGQVLTTALLTSLLGIHSR